MSGPLGLLALFECRPEASPLHRAFAATSASGPLTCASRTPYLRISVKAGLCDSCRHQKLIRNTRGSTFSMCELSKADKGYPKYPRLPVKRCPGWEQRG